jgi:flagellar FliL protein
MATTPSSGEIASAKVQAKVPVFTVLIAVVLGVWIGLAGAGGGAYLLIRSGRIPLGGLAPAGVAAAGATTTHPLVLEPILVNLADEGGHAYLRLGLTLDVADEAGGVTGSAIRPTASEGAAKSGGKGDARASEADGAIRDTVLTVLSRQTSASLLGPDGKEHLKLELKEAIAKNNPKVKVQDVFFTDFLVQI